MRVEDDAAPFFIVFNIGSGGAISFIDLIGKIIELTGSGRSQFAPFTEERKALEPYDVLHVHGIDGMFDRIARQELARQNEAKLRCKIVDFAA